MVKLIASDLDGTIIDKNNNICQDNLKAIEKINSKKIPFVVCTGKTYSVFKCLCSTFSASYGIFGNGTSIINLKTGEKIYENLLNPSTVEKCIEFAKENHLHVHIYTNNYIITEELLYLDLRNYKLQKNHIYNNELKFKIVPDLLKYIKNKILHVSNVVISGTSPLDDIRNDILSNLDVEVLNIKKYGKYKDNIINKEYEYLDIIPKNVNKDTALSFLSNYLNINKSEILAIGDNLNDLNLVKNAGIGVAVNNAYIELKNIAKYTTNTPVEKGAFAEAIYKFVKF